MLHVSGGLTSFPSVCLTDIARVCCTAVRRWVVQGVLLGEVALPGVVVVYGRVRSSWCDVHQPALWWEEVTPQPLCRLLPCAWPVRDSRRACAAVRRRCRSCGWVRLRVLGGVPRVAEGRCGGCTRAVCAARASVSVRMAGCCCLPSASARFWQIAVFDNTPVVIGSAVGPACLARPFARPLADPLRGRGRSGGMTGPTGFSFVSDTMGC